MTILDCGAVVEVYLGYGVEVWGLGYGGRHLTHHSNVVSAVACYADRRDC